MASSFTIGGLISGLKTADMIDQLVSIEAQPIKLLQAQSNRESTRLKAVDNVKSLIDALRDATSALIAPGGVNAKIASVDTGGSTTTVVTAAAGPSALNGTYNVTVSQLATATRARATGPLGLTIDRTSTLANAGFGITPVTEKAGNPASFTVNGVAISIDNTTTLDDGTANSVIAKINAAGAGVTATLIADADGRANNRIQLVSSPGQIVQVGSSADTSNLLGVLGLTNTASQGYTAATTTGSAAAAGALSGNILINGVTTLIDQADGGFSAEQNAAFIADAITATVGSTVTAISNGDGTITLTQRTAGAQKAIAITTASAGLGFATGTTANGTDRMLSTTSLGVAAIGSQLTNARLATPISGLDPQGNGSFSINGVAITYSGTDSLTTVVNRINNSAAGVSALYDSFQDRVVLTASKTGATSITLADTTGNFLAATGLASASQTMGQSALFSIDAINGGQQLASSTNTVSGFIPGVTLQLRSTSATPVAVTIGQDTSSVTTQVKQFVASLNAALGFIANQTQYDATTKQAGILTGDNDVQNIARTVRLLTSNGAAGAAGAYRSLADLGITGSKSPVGSSGKVLTLDEVKLSKALQDSPQEVASVLSGVVGGLDNYLKQLLGANGAFASRTASSNAITRRLAQKIDDMQVKLEAKQDALTRRFAALEASLAQIQTQSSALSSQIAYLTKQQQ